jgi:hypothetical protein
MKLSELGAMIENARNARCRATSEGEVMCWNRILDALVDIVKMELDGLPGQ